MRRIGHAASKMAQGNVFKYNCYVIIIATLCSVLLLTVCAVALLTAFFVIFMMLRVFFPSTLPGEWWALVKWCLVLLAVLIAGLNILAIVMNIRFRRPKL